MQLLAGFGVAEEVADQESFIGVGGGGVQFPEVHVQGLRAFVQTHFVIVAAVAVVYAYYTVIPLQSNHYPALVC